MGLVETAADGDNAARGWGVERTGTLLDTDTELTCATVGVAVADAEPARSPVDPLAAAELADRTSSVVECLLVPVLVLAGPALRLPRVVGAEWVLLCAGDA